MRPTYSPMIPKKKRLTPDRNVITTINAVKPWGECSKNLAYKADVAKRRDDTIALAPRIAAARKGTIENAKIPSDASFSNLNGLYFLIPPRPPRSTLFPYTTRLPHAFASGWHL